MFEWPAHQGVDAVSWCGSGRQRWWLPKPRTGSVQRNFLFKWVFKFICLWNIALVRLYPILWRIWVSTGVRCMWDMQQSSPIPKWCPVLVSSIPSALSPCTSCCCSGRAREQGGWSWLWCFTSPPTSLNRLPSFETRAHAHCPPNRQLFRWSSMFWKRSPQSRRVIYLLFSQPERGARDARHGNLPLELGGGQDLGLGCSVAPLHMAVGGWRGIRHLCFCPRSSHVTAVPAALSWRRNLHQTKGYEGLCVYRQEA